MLENHEKDTFVLNKFFMWLVCVFYTISVTFVDNGYFRDRGIYAWWYATYPDYILNSYNGLNLLVNEPLFIIFNLYLAKIMSPDNIVTLMVFIIVYSCSILIWKYSRNICYLFLGLLILFFFPYLFHFQFVVLRQALATLVFLIPIIFISNAKVKNILILLSPFIHSLFFLIVPIYFLYLFFKGKNIKFDKILFAFFLISIASNFLFYTLGNFLGFRQMNEEHITGEVVTGGGAFIFFILIFLYLYKFYREKRDFIYEFSLILLIFFLATYFFLPIAGRLMSTLSLIILLNLIKSSNIINFLVILLFLAVSFYLAFIFKAMDNGSLNVSLGVVLDYILHFRGII